MVKKALFPILLLTITLFIIFYKFNQIPANLNWDEVEFARLALSLNNSPYTPYSELATGHSTLYFYILLLSFKVFGLSSFALRLPSAIFGVLSVMAFYVLISLQIKKHFIFYSYKIPFAFIAGLLLITQRWFFNFARFSFEITFLLIIELCTLLCVTRLIKVDNLRRRDIYTLLTGVGAGLAYNSYLSGRIFFLLVGLWATVMLWERKNVLARYLIIYTFTFVICTLPLNAYLLKNTDIRISQQSYFNNSDITVLEKASYLGRNIISYPLMFFWNGKGDISGIHNYPLKPSTNPIILISMLIGLWFGLKSKTRKTLYLYVLWGVFSVIPALMTYPWENPHMLRTFTLLPVISVFSAFGFYQIQVFLKRYQVKYFGLLLLSLILASSMYELRTYYHYQAEVFKESFSIRNQLRGVEKKYRDNL